MLPVDLQPYLVEEAVPHKRTSLYMYTCIDPEDQIIFGSKIEPRKLD